MLSGVASKVTPHHRKINCTLQNALVERAAWWAAKSKASLLFHSLLPKRYATANNPAITNIASNPGVGVVFGGVVNGV